MLIHSHSDTADPDMDDGIADEDLNAAIDDTIEAEAAAADDKKSEVSSAVGMTTSAPRAKVVKAKGKASTPGAESKSKSKSKTNSKASTPGAEVEVEVPAKN